VVTLRVPTPAYLLLRVVGELAHPVTPGAIHPDLWHVKMCNTRGVWLSTTFGCMEKLLQVIVSS
jgi:hypothetical protein